MANVKFLKGTQSGFNAISSYTAGAFYLTTDTDRLYFAQSDSEAVYLNKYIVTLDNITALNNAMGKELHKGDLALVLKDNAGASLNALVYMTADNAYAQINAQTVNTDTNTYVKGASFSAGTVTDADKVVYDLTLTREKKNEVSGAVESVTSVIGSLTVEREDLVDVLDLSLNSAVADRKVTIDLNSAGTQIATTNFTLPEDKDTYIDELTAAWGAVSNGKAGLTITAGRSDDQNFDDTVNVVAGKDISLSTSGDDLTINHATYNAVTPSNTKDDLALSGSDGFTAVTGVTLSNGHVTGINTTTFSLPEDKYVESAEFAWGTVSDNASELGLKLTRSDGEVVDESVNVKGGTDITLSQASDVLTVAHKTYGAVTPVQAGTAKTEDIVAVTGLTLTNGHVTGINTTKFVDTYVDEIAHTYSSGKLKTVLTNNQDETVDSNELTLQVKINNQNYNLNTSLDEGIKAIVAKELTGANAMVYKGAVSALPTTGLENGNTYLVSGNGFTVNGQAAKAGDLIVYSDPDGSGSQAAGWTLIPSANEVDTTYDFTVVDGNNIATLAIQDSHDADYNVDFVGDSWVKVDGDATNRDIKFTHAAPGTGSAVTATLGSSTATSVAYGGEFTAVVGAKADSKGHITGIDTQKFKLPAEQTYALKADATNKKAELRKNDSAVVGSIKVDGANNITVEASGTGEDIAFTVKHNAVTAATPDTIADVKPSLVDSLATARQFTVVDGVKKDAYGHVTAVNTKNVVMPQLSVGVANETVSFKEGDAEYSSVKFAGGTSINVTTSDSQLTIAHAAPGTGSAVTATLESSTATDVAYGGEFTAIVGAKADATGHITGVTTKKFKLPAEKIYAFTTSVGTDGKISYALKKDEANVSTGTIGFTSETLKITGSGSNIDVELEWGTF